MLNAPDGYLDLFPSDVHVDRALGEGPYGFAQLFATHREELLSEGPRLRNALQPQGVLWVSYPKGKALPTDLNRDIVRNTLAEVSLEVVTQVAIDETWSALRAKRM